MYLRNGDEAMEFIHMGDVHLGYIPDEGQSWSDLRIREIYITFEKTIESIASMGVDFLFITGDLFDHIPTTKELVWLDNLFLFLNNVNIIIINGERDYIGREAPIEKFEFKSRTFLLSGVQLSKERAELYHVKQDQNANAFMDSLYFKDFNVRVYGTCYYSNYNRRHTLDGVRPIRNDCINILLAHGGDDMNTPIDFDELKISGFNYVALGHIHNYKDLCDGRIAYCGSLEPLQANETGQHGYIKGYLDNDSVKIKFVGASLRQYINIDYEIDDTTINQDIINAISRYIKNYGNENLFTINLVRKPQCRCEFNIEELREKYNIVDIVGQTPYDITYDKVIVYNLNNKFGHDLKSLSEDASIDSSAVRYLIKAVVKEKNYDSSLVEAVIVDDDEYNNIKTNIIKNLMYMKKDIEQNPLFDEFKVVGDELAENKSVMENLNRAWANERSLQNKLNELTFREKYIPKVFKRNSIGLGLTLCFIDLVVFILYLLGGIGSIVVRADYDKLITSLIGILGSIVLFFVGYSLYRLVEKISCKLSGNLTHDEQLKECRESIRRGSIELGEAVEKRKLLDEQQKMHEYVVIRMSKLSAKTAKLNTEIEAIDAAIELLQKQ